MSAFHILARVADHKRQQERRQSLRGYWRPVGPDQRWLYVSILARIPSVERDVGRRFKPGQHKSWRTWHSRKSRLLAQQARP
jgi:hypothetical protein